MLIKDKDILVQDKPKEEEEKKVKHHIKKEYMKHAWGDAFDSYLRGITENYLLFGSRATRLEFWGYFTAACITLIPIFLLGEYVEMPLLPFYYVLATFIPSLAITVRRLHDIQKKAWIYLGVLPLLGLSAFFISYGALLLIFAYLILLIRLLSMPTDIQDGFFGAAKENDEIYEEDNPYILKKFRLMALVLSAVWFVIALSSFDDWKTQNAQKQTINEITEKVMTLGTQENLSLQQIDQAQDLMHEVLKHLSGKTVSPEDLEKEINRVVQSVKTQE